MKCGGVTLVPPRSGSPQRMTSGRSWLWGGACLLGAGVIGFACGGATSRDSTADGGSESSSPVCTTCTTDSQCGGGICVTLPGGSFCAPSCDTPSQCGAGTACTPVNSATSGNQVGACVDLGGACGLGPTEDGGTPATCGVLAGPTTDAGCTCPAGRTCNANGCRYQYYCNTTTSMCQPAPVGCGTPGQTYMPGPAPTGTVGTTGGAVSRLYFAVVGDTRPPNQDETSAYPTAIITQIFQDLQALSPQPTFAISTGDYQYANPTGTQGPTQIDLYLGARAKYSGTVFPAMGNHECTGFTDSNCGTGNADGLTNNYNAFVSMMLTPVAQSSPYYEIDVAAPDASWTAKLLFVAANAWTQTQANWLDQAMARATTYTFLVRHEPASADTAPGVNPAEIIMLKHPYTLSIVGHSHLYQRSGPREVIFGNGGAPLSGTGDYGFGMISQQPDGSVAVDMIDYTSGLADSSFHFAVNPDGSAAN